MQGATAFSCVQQCFRPSNCFGTFWRQRCRQVSRFVHALYGGFLEIGYCRVAVGLKRLLPPSIR
ncbi:hypothetical protein [Nostoc sp. DSM 114167]|uniref:hypothetical protein n=1 Tax=Nostoc sp. DSM 114167 TaxID=3439050 RepID=UPI004045DED1